MLALSKVQQRHDRGLLVLGRVALEDLVHEFLVLLIELEGDRGVVVGGVTVLPFAISASDSNSRLRRPDIPPPKHQTVSHRIPRKTERSTSG